VNLGFQVLEPIHMPGKTSAENGKKGGRPKGKRSKSTLEKEAVLAEVRKRIMANAQRILDSQLSLSQGQTFLYKIEKKKEIGPRGGVSYKRQKPALVTAQWEIEKYLNGLIGEGDPENENDPAATYYFITTKEPNNMAIDSMFDRAFGTPTKRVEMTGEDGEPIRVLWEQ